MDFKSVFLKFNVEKLSLDYNMDLKAKLKLKATTFFDPIYNSLKFKLKEHK